MTDIRYSISIDTPRERAFPRVASGSGAIGPLFPRDGKTS